MTSVALAIFPSVQALDVAGPLDAFTEANHFIGADRAYALTLVAADRMPVRASNGMLIMPDASFEEAGGGFDLVLVAGGPALPATVPDPRLTRWLTAMAVSSPRYGSICNGAFALGHAGLLDGRTVTTHWQDAPRLAAQFPEARVELDRIHVRDGGLVTSAGVTAGIDLALALIQEDHGGEVALAVARRLVVVAQRQGGQSQFSPYLTPLGKPDSPVARVHAHVMAQLRDAHRVETLAAIAGMSLRNFARAFKQETGLTPAAFVESLRLDAARNRLEAGGLALKVVAHECGFTSAEHMRLTFVRSLGVTPSQYRASFGRS